MKNYLILLTALSLAFGMTSCQKNDVNLNESIEGLWELVSSTRTDCDNPDNNGTSEYPEIDCPSDTTEICFKLSYEFNSDNIFAFTVENTEFGETNTVTYFGTYYYDGTILNTCDENGRNCEQRAFDVNGNTGILGEIEGLNYNCDITMILQRE